MMIVDRQLNPLIVPREKVATPLPIHPLIASFYVHRARERQRMSSLLAGLLALLLVVALEVVLRLGPSLVVEARRSAVRISAYTVDGAADETTTDEDVGSNDEDDVFVGPLARYAEKAARFRDGYE